MLTDMGYNILIGTVSSSYSLPASSLPWAVITRRRSASDPRQPTATPEEAVSSSSAAVATGEVSAIQRCPVLPRLVRLLLVPMMFAHLTTLPTQALLWLLAPPPMRTLISL